jgi:hypothetical protein
VNHDPVTGVPPEPAGTWLMSQSLAHPDKLATAMRLIAADGRSNDSCLHARQFLEHALGAARQRPLSSADYRHAANLLDSGGHAVLGAVMESLASVDGELHAAAPAWLRRYAARPQTQPERAADEQLRSGSVAESGYAGQGIDGAHYARAYYPRSGRPAVVITTSAMTEEIVNFANTADAAAWLASRSAGIAGPLPTSASGPSSRTAREEELLAFLVRDPGSAARLAAMAGPATFTTHLRAELFTALRWTTRVGGTPGYSVIAEAYGRRLLRAPADAATDIGWPNATRAMTYLNRLASTPVTESQATAAASLLAAVDAAASRGRQQMTPAVLVTRHAPAVTPAPGQRQLLQPPPPLAPLAPGRGSPAPRLLGHPERTRLTPARPMTLPGQPEHKRAPPRPPVTRRRWRKGRPPPAPDPAAGR